MSRTLRIYIDKAREGLIAAGEEVATTDEILGTAATTTAAASAWASA